MATRWMLLLTILSVAAALCGAVPVAAAPIFSSAELTFDAISPNHDGVQEFTEIRYTIAVDSAEVRITLLQGAGGPVLETLQVFTRQGGTHSRIFDGVIGSGALPDGVYEVQILGNGTGGQGQEQVNLALTIDRAAPVFTSLDLVSPEIPVLRDGQRVTIQACVTGSPQTVAADFSALDSEYAAPLVTQTPVGQTCTRFSYTVSTANTKADQDDLPVVVTARDRAGNSAQRTFLLCLSNNPPTIVDTRLLNQFTVLQNGDQILVEVAVNAVNPVTVGADLGELDSDFDPADVVVTPLGGNRFRLAYTLATGNIRPDGEYTLRILAFDLTGCGIDEDASLSVILDNRGLLPALIDDVRLSVPAISPADMNGINDAVTISFRVLEDTVRVIGSVNYVRQGDPKVLNLRLFSADFTQGPQSHQWDGTFTLPFSEIPDQILSVALRAVSAAKDRQRDVALDLELDHTPPRFLSFRPPVPAQVRNGQRVDFSVVMDRPLYSVSVDFSALDSEHLGRSVAVSDSGNGAYGLSYVVSDINSIADGSNKIIPITAVDRAGNAATDEGFVRLCLSNQPPRLASAVLLESQGPFGSGDQIVLRTEWVEGRWSVTQPLTITADFSAVDTEFSDRKDRVTVLPQASTTQGVAVFDIAYRISTGNDNEQSPPAGYAIKVTASDHPDLGCGSTTVAALYVEYDDLSPLRPVFTPPAAVVRTGVITLSGEAQDAEFVQILRNDAVVDTFDVDALARFSGQVTLAPGANIFSALGLDRAGNLSKPSPPVEVFFVEGNLFDIPGPFAPGSDFFVALQDQASLVTVRVFNLEGIEIARVSAGPGDLFRIPWDGRDDTGGLSSSGPYLAVADIERADGGHELMKKAFFFSRRRK